MDGGIWLRSNGQPTQLTADTAVHTDGYPAGTPWLDLVHATGSEQPLTVDLPLADQYRFIDQLRDAAERGVTILTIHLHPGGLRIGARQEAAPRRS